MPLALPEPCLCLVTDRRVGDESTLVHRAVEAVTGGVDMVQVREKDLPGCHLLSLAASLQDAVKDAVGSRALLIINERADVALAAGADGVQLAEDAMPVAAVRRIMGPQALIGRSVHSEEGAVRAAADGADFLIVGTMYATSSHPAATPAGPGLVRRIAHLLAERATSIPLIGIGGITADNQGEVIRAGAAGVAVITNILASPDPRGEAQRLKQAMLNAWSPTRASAGRGPGASGRTTPTGGSSTQ
ncbi:MAG: thiamine phosphate synthase [Dehalococcoidia bacterium]|jgi:thiamine-phosphate pyrophosphorylase|nr:thiamine phosphate synthase [Dehalococcoidia bacterium]